MRIDLYTKVVLTVIAVCLVWISLGGPSVLTPVSAQVRTSGYQRVVLAGWSDSGGIEKAFNNEALPVTGATPGR